MMQFTESKYEPMMSDSLRYRPPGRCFVQHTGGVAAMTSEELLKRLQEFHKISVDKKTPYNYAKYGWIPAPKVINKGRAGGKVIDYEECSSVEFVASYRLKREKKVSKEEVALARAFALNLLGPVELSSAEDIVLYQKTVKAAVAWINMLEEAKEVEDLKYREYKAVREKLLNSGPGEQIRLLMNEIRALQAESDQVLDEFFAASIAKREKVAEMKNAGTAWLEPLTRSSREIADKQKTLQAKIAAINDEVSAKARIVVYGQTE